VAHRLTIWENNPTKTDFNNSLIYKIFIFQFINSYASLFYLSYFRNINFQNGIFNYGPEYQDKCKDDDCMGLLAIQILTILVLKSVIPLLKDFLLP
jgi:hypothetical protein